MWRPSLRIELIMPMRRCLSLARNPSQSFYSNPVLNGAGFNSPSTSRGLIQFTPNYRLITGLTQSPIPNAAAAATATQAAAQASAQASAQSQVSTDIGFCHPVSEAVATDTKLPFEVKAKKRSVDKRTVLEQYVAGDIPLKKMIKPYVVLTKPNLTFLIMLSSTCSYVLAPGASDVFSFLCLTTGTSLASGAANAINMGREPAYDAQMVRTSTRPVVSGKITPNEAYTFAAITGALGCGILYFGVNPMVAGLGLLNIFLYSWVYTSLKRRSILNTWVGAIVGAIPPLMGWAACSSLTDPGAWCLAALLYAWQFPHFNSLSHNIAKEYQKAGYVMTAFVNPKLNARVALRYSMLMFPICIGISYFGVCDNWFAVDSSILNAYLTYWSFKFWWQQHKNYSKETLAAGGPTKEAIQKASIYARSTFWGSIWQLPVVLALMMLHKSGQWDRLFADKELA